MAKLFWLQPDSSIIEFPLNAEQNVIGRTSRCDVRIKHPGISAEHAVIRVLPGSATVEDLGSTNGTRVNGKKIELHTLRHGDQIGVGRERLMYFAELDEAAKFMQPESIEPFALPAAGGELVNTTPTGLSSSPVPLKNAPVDKAAPTTDADAFALWSTAKPHTTAQAGGTANLGPKLDPALLAALPTGASLANLASMAKVKSPATAMAGVRATAPITARELAAPVAASASSSPSPTLSQSQSQPLSASVSVLTGVAAGKRYPLNQPTVTLGKEGKQVIEFVHASPTRWQVRQREGVTPAYINGDALAGLHDLAAGDVIELTGVRLRFEISLTQ